MRLMQIDAIERRNKERTSADETLFDQYLRLRQHTQTQEGRT